MTGIYKITNKINNKSYIGLSINIKARWRAHRSRPFQLNCHQYNCHLYKAIRKYGLENFDFSIIEECLPEELSDKEIYWISYYNTNDPNFGYNNTDGGEYARPFSKITEDEAKEIQEYLIYSKISQEKLGEMFSLTQRSISDINTGNTWFNSQLDYPLRKKSILINKDKLNKICQYCGKPISNNAFLCENCVKIESRIVERPTREELKKLIRTIPFTQIAKQYNVTDNAIRKWCDYEKLPRKKRNINKYTDEEWDKI